MCRHFDAFTLGTKYNGSDHSVTREVKLRRKSYQLCSCGVHQRAGNSVFEVLITGPTKSGGGGKDFNKNQLHQKTSYRWLGRVKASLVFMKIKLGFMKLLWQRSLLSFMAIVCYATYPLIQMLYVRMYIFPLRVTGGNSARHYSRWQKRF